MSKKNKTMNILRIITSPRGSKSQSIKLGNAIVERIQIKKPDSILKIRNLSTHPFPHLNEIHLASFFTSQDNRTTELEIAIENSEGAIEEVFEADTIVIDVPMYNFGIPSTLKSWIDHIARAGKTFKYTSNGAEGLVKNKKIYLAIATGGIYSEGIMKNFDFTESYLRAVLGFLGVIDITTFRVEGTALPEGENVALTRALKLVRESPIS